MISEFYLLHFSHVGIPCEVEAQLVHQMFANRLVTLSRVQQPLLLLRESIEMFGETFSIQFCDAGDSLVVRVFSSEGVAVVEERIASSMWGKAGVLRLEYLSEDMKLQICEVFMASITQIGEAIVYDVTALHNEFLRLKCAVGMQAPRAPSLSRDSLSISVKPKKEGCQLKRTTTIHISEGELISLGHHSLNWLNDEEQICFCKNVVQRLSFCFGRLHLKAKYPVVLYCDLMHISCAPSFARVSLVDTGLLLEIKHIELGEMRVLKVNMNTLVEIDPVLFSSSPDLSCFRLGWLEENLLQNLSKKIVGCARIENGVLRISAKWDGPQVLTSFGTRGTLVKCVVWKNVLVLNMLSAIQQKSVNLLISQKCVSTWCNFGCQKMSWVDLNECTIMVRSLEIFFTIFIFLFIIFFLHQVRVLVKHLIRRHHLEEITMEGEISFLKLLATIVPTLHNKGKEGSDLLVRLKQLSTSIQNDFSTDNMEIATAGKEGQKLPVLIKYAKELEDSLSGNITLVREGNVPSIKLDASQSIFDYHNGILMLHQIELMREAKSMLFNWWTRTTMIPFATEEIRKRLASYYSEKTATGVQSLQDYFELRSIIQNQNSILL